ncbi:MAG TPA: tetratricopeptide repeat protein [Casimicrobiaceae bacterium]|nr:tetratricopeptide repeat protein [Casimicrobiaceae bacterium]
MRKAFGVACLQAGVGLAALVQAMLAYATLPPGVAAEVVDLQGSGERRASSDVAWLQARPRDDLSSGAFVRTGAASKMALLFADETQVRLNQNSVLQVKQVATGEHDGTALRLELGRAWSQAKRAPNGLQIETPSATAAIRGTAWEIEVDPTGRATLVVQTGEVEFFNELGRVSVAANEAAVAEVGRAPVKIVLANPRDRVQWVNALRFDTRRYAVAASSSLPLRSALQAIDRGDFAAARALLAAERAARSSDPAIYAALGDLELVAGNFDAAIGIYHDGLAITRTDDPRLRAETVRAQLLSDRIAEAEQALAGARVGESADLLIAQGEVARREGRAGEALSSFTQATRLAPDDDRAWYSLGAAQNEREDTRPARRNLLRALELNPQGAGYAGELATLETFANRFAAAERAFEQALQANPGDYVALTGLGLLRLKQGRPRDALDALLRAGVLEPRFARAKIYTAVAYYQLGRHADAISTLLQAAQLDDKDPLPYLILSQIYTDLFRAGDAVQASREALQRLPYLKSLNQVANDQQGRANLGFALAFFGLEEWALEIAQQSYYPYSGASHLFLSDRYQGPFNKNSELFQGFLTDPTAFGGSNRFSTLVPTAGHYATLGSTYSRDSDDRLWNPYLRLNGLFDVFARGAYFIDAERGVGTIDTSDVDPDGKSVQVKGDRRVELYALGLGTLVNDELGVFGYATKIRQSVILRNLTRTEGDEYKERGDFGVSYRFSPTSMTWFKYGRTNEQRAFDRYFIASEDVTAANGANSSFSSRPEEYQLRHTMDLSPVDHLALGAETSRDRRLSNFFAGSVSTRPGVPSIGVLVDTEANLASRQAYVSYTRDVSAVFTVQGDLFWQRFRQDITEFDAVLVTLGDQSFPATQTIAGSTTDTKWNARAGFVLKPGNVVVRGAWQEWIQPASVSTLAPVATAGIEMDDRLVSAGGNGKRAVLRAHFEPDAFTAIAAFIDDEKIRNLGESGFRIPTPQIEFVDLLRNTQLFNVSTLDPLEGTPDFDAGRATATGISVNRILTPQLSIAGKYVYTRNEADVYYKDDAGNLAVANKVAKIPYLPRHFFAAGLTWASPQHLYVSAQAVYRSQRFTDRDNTDASALRADWNGQVVAFWETADKRCIVGLAALNLGSKGAGERYIADVRIRF